MERPMRGTPVVTGKAAKRLLEEVEKNKHVVIPPERLAEIERNAAYLWSLLKTNKEKDKETNKE